MAKLKIKEVVSTLFDELVDIPNHSYHSWEHCHRHFSAMKNRELGKRDIKILELYLGFYLASWGMYRGSSFILQKDFTIYKEIILEIMNLEYEPLWDLKNKYKTHNLNHLFVELYEEIEQDLLAIKKTVNDKDNINQNKMSDTLVTKILLGTIGCIPAYDTFLKNGVKEIEDIQQSFNPNKSFQQMLDFYVKNKDQIDAVDLPKIYTPMRIIDMYFWQKGRNK